jgi:hypothetical protein
LVVASRENSWAIDRFFEYALNFGLENSETDMDINLSLSTSRRGSVRSATERAPPTASPPAGLALSH